MSSAQNKALVRRLYEAFNARDFGAIEAIAAAGFLDHTARPGQPPGAEGVIFRLNGLRSVFPDVAWVVEDLVAEGDTVVACQTAEGTHEGTFLGVPPTGRHVRVPGMGILRVADGQLVELSGISDMLGVLQQLGAAPTPAPPTEDAAVARPRQPPPRDGNVAGGMASVETNKAVIRRHFAEVLNDESRAAAEELLLPERVDRLLDLLAYARSSRPDLRRTIDEIVAEGDRVAVRWTATGTHIGEWTHPATGPIAPTGKVVTNTAITIYRLAGGRIVEAWEVSNLLGLLQQMGARVGPGQPTSEPG